MKQKLLLFILTVITTAGYGQRWIEMMKDQNVNFYEVREEANRYFENRDKGKGSGWKQFKRWKYEMQFQIDETGNRLDGRMIWNEMEKFENLHAASRAANPVANWTELGPKSWSGTSGWNPGIGRITSIAVNPANQSIIYIGSPGGGVWKTTNGGSTWAALTDNLTVLDIFSIGIDPVNTNIVYIGTQGGGILKSTNGGSSFSAATLGIPATATIRCIRVDPSNNSIVLAATSSGIYRSANGGSNWVAAVTGSFEDLEFKPGNSSVVYASGTSFWKSTTNGQAFTQIVNGIVTTGRSCISVTPANPNYVYVLQANATNEFRALFRSIDSGTSFTTRVTGNPANGTNYFCHSPNGTDAGGMAGHSMSMCVSPTNAEEVHIGSAITWKSINGGSSFVATTEWIYPNTTGYTHCDMHALEYVGNTIYTGSDGGIYKSTDGANNFTDLSTGLGIRQFYRLGGSKTDPSRIAGGAQDNGSSILRSGTWIDWLGGDGMETMIDYTNANVIYGTSQNGALYKSTDGGNSKTNIASPPGNGAWVTPFIMHPTTSSTLFVGYTQVFKSTNGGGSWTKISSFADSSIHVGSMAIAPSNPSYIYASKGNILYVTKNGGSTWTTAASGGGTIQYITVHSSNPEKIAITTSGGTGRVYTSANAGLSWTNISGSLPALAGKCVIYQDGVEEGLLLALTTGIYYKNSSMSDWVPFMDNLPKVQVSELEIHKSTGKIRVATYGRGIWESNLPCISPTALFVSNITTSSATLNWGARSNAILYDVMWRQAGGGAWTGFATVGTNSVNVTNLQAGNYEFTVRTNCAGGVSDYAMPYFAFTIPPCPIPSGLSVSNITTSSATLNWSAQSHALSYHVMWRPVGSAWMGEETVSANSLNITGLHEGDYEFTVRTNCTGGASNYAMPYFAFTIPPCSMPTGLSTSNITSSCAILTWDDQPGVPSYGVGWMSVIDRIWSNEVITSNKIKICGLTPATPYEFSVWVECMDGSIIIGEPSHFITPLFEIDSIDSGDILENDSSLYDREPSISAVYPNPTSGITNWEITIPEYPGIPDYTFIKLSISDPFGKNVGVVFEGYLTTGVHTMIFDMSAMSSGIYMCSLVTDKNVQTIELIKK